MYGTPCAFCRQGCLTRPVVVLAAADEAEDASWALLVATALLAPAAEVAASEPVGAGALLLGTALVAMVVGTLLAAAESVLEEAAAELEEELELESEEEEPMPATKGVLAPRRPTTASRALIC